MQDREPTVRARHLGRALLDAMQAKGYMSQEVAAELGCSTSKISRVLTGKRGMSQVDLASLLALCGITGESRDRLLRLADEVAESAWLEEFGTHLPIDLPVLCDLEDTASSVTGVHTLTVPALAQTEGYRRALLHATPVIPDAEVTDRLTHHHARRQLLDRDNPPTVRFFITQHALTAHGVGRDVLCDQVHHLLRLAVRPHIEIRMIPTHSGLLAVCPSFQLMTFTDFRPVVYFEHLTSTTFLDHPTTIASYQRLLTDVSATALDPELSRAHLATIALTLSELTIAAHPKQHSTAGSVKS